jgi:predicted RNase H-like HicB family nuclease
VGCAATYLSRRFRWALRQTSRKEVLEVSMRAFTAVIERCSDTGLFVGYVPGFPGAHSQGETLDELQQNLAEVIGMLLEDGEPKLDSEFIGTQTVQVAGPCPSCRC